MVTTTIRAFVAAVALVCAIALGSGTAEAKRVALVIGNQQYEHLPSLQKSAADASSFAELFQAKAFDKVIFRQNLTRIGMDAAVSDFVEALEPGDTAVFFYAGHGWSDGSQNYLVPTDAPREGSQDFLKRVSLPIANGATGVLDAVEQKGATLKVAIIDACRDNPFTAADGTRSIGLSRGFNRMPEPSSGTFVVFSAGAGQTALDRLSDADTNPNGVFTRTFVPLLKADLTLLDATKEAQEQVFEIARSVGHDQQPAFYDETRGNKACLSGRCGIPVPAGETATDEAAWLRIAASTDPADFESFARIFPTSSHAAEAQRRATAPRPQVAALPPATTGPAAEPIDLSLVAPGPLLRQGSSINDVAVSPDGHTALTSGTDGIARLWDVATGRVIRTFKARAEFVNAVAFSPDGRTIVTGHTDHIARMWDAASGKLIRTFTGHADVIVAVAFSPDGRRLATASFDHTFRLWDVDTGRPIRVVEDLSDVEDVAFSPDGRRIVTGSYGRSARLWDAETGHLILRFEGHSDSVFAAGFSPDGSMVVTGSYDHTAKLWSTITGQLLRTFEGHTDAIFAVAFSPDGRSIITGSEDHTAIIWDVASGQLIRTLRGHAAVVRAVAFSRDGHTIITGSDDKTARIWTLAAH